MKSIFLFLFFLIGCFPSSSFASSDAGNAFRSLYKFLPVGTYPGIDDEGRECTVKVFVFHELYDAKLFNHSDMGEDGTIRGPTFKFSLFDFSYIPGPGKYGSSVSSYQDTGDFVGVSITTDDVSARIELQAKDGKVSSVMIREGGWLWSPRKTCFLK